MYYYYLVVLLLFHIFMIIIRKTARERHVWIRGSGNYIFCGVLWKRDDIDLPLYLGWVTGYEGRGGFGGGKDPQTSVNSTPDYCNHFGKIRIFR